MIRRWVASMGALPLRVKLIAALVATSLIGIAVSYTLVSAVTLREFDRLLIGREQETITALLTDYYTANGSLDGLFEALHGANGTAGLPPFNILEDLYPESVYGGPPDGDGPPDGFPFARGIVITDTDGTVIISDGRYAPGETFPDDASIIDRQPVEVDGEIIGVVIAFGGAPPLDPREQRYLETTRAALLTGAGAAVLTSILVGAILSGALLRPLRALTGAVRRMGAGQLAQRVEVHTRDEIGTLADAFNDLSDRLARSQALRRQMTADIAHELRSPLTVISGTLEGLRDGTLKSTPARFESLYSEARQLGRLIDDLRTLSLADSGELRLNRARVAPSELVTSAAESFRPAAETRGLTLAVEDGPPGTVPDVDIDRERLTQVLANLIGNALRYARTTITLCVEPVGGGVALHVRDDGSGIAPDKLPHIFERFYRADEARDDESGGTGLGLAIARSIVIAHGGMLHADSTLHSGTTLTVWLPAHANHTPS